MFSWKLRFNKQGFVNYCNIYLTHTQTTNYEPLNIDLPNDTLTQTQLPSFPALLPKILLTC